MNRAGGGGGGGTTCVGVDRGDVGSHSRKVDSIPCYCLRSVDGGVFPLDSAENGAKVHQTFNSREYLLTS